MADFMCPARHMYAGVIPGFVVWDFVIIVLIVAIFYWLTRGSRDRRTPLDILKERYARGEIGSEEYERIKAELAD